MGASKSKKSAKPTDEEYLRAVQKALSTALKKYQAEFLATTIVSYLPDPSKEPRKMKVVMWGSAGVGKSSLTIRFVTGMFVDEYGPTIEDIYRKLVDIDERPYLFDILDTACREEFTSISDVCLLEAHIVLICYSITERRTWDAVELYRKRLLRTRENVDGHCTMMLVGTKCDLEEYRQVTTVEARQKADEWNVPFFETSAKDGVNHEEVFYEAVRHYMHNAGRLISNRKH